MREFYTVTVKLERLFKRMIFLHSLNGHVQVDYLNMVLILFKLLNCQIYHSKMAKFFIMITYGGFIL